MKIDERIMPRSIQQVSSNRAERAGEAAGLFGTFLKEEIAAEGLALGESRRSQEVVDPARVHCSPPAAAAALEGEGLLLQRHLPQSPTGLDGIAASLEKGTPDLRRIEQIISELGAEARRLEERTAALPGAHPLRTVSNELNVLAFVEEVKWRRGDYV
jgi:hypothetical protein